MIKKVDFDDVFNEEEDSYEVINLIRFEDYEGASNLKDELNYNSGWYNYSTVTFDYKGKRYSIEYKEHTSDNVCDMEYLFNTFVCLGEAKEMDEKITKEDMTKIKMQYEKQIEDLNKYKDVLNKLKPLSKEHLKRVGNMLISIEEESQEEEKTNRLDVGTVGEFLIEFSKMRKH